MSSADRQHFTLLEHAEELGLQFERHLPDFVEEHDAALGGAEDAERAAGSPGERPLLVTEQLAFGE